MPGERTGVSAKLDERRFFKGNGQRGVYPVLVWSNGGIGQTRPREAPARAPDCPKFSSDALARCPQTLPSTHTFSFFFSTSLGLTGPRRTRGLRDIPPFYHMLGAYAPANLLNLCISLRVTILYPHLTEIIPLHYHIGQPPKQVQTHLSARHRTTARTAQGPNNRQLRVVAIDFFGK